MNIPEDPFIRELLPEFVDTWISDLDSQLGSLIDEKNSGDLYRLAHTLKGSCFQFGLDEVANMGIELMGYAKNCDWNKAKAMEFPIKSAFANVRKYLIENGYMTV